METLFISNSVKVVSPSKCSPDPVHSMYRVMIKVGYCWRLAYTYKTAAGALKKAKSL